MADDNVRAFPGFSVPSVEPVPEVVALLEEALEKAKSGKLQGAAVVMVERNPDAFELVYYARTARHTLASGAMALAWRFARAMSESESETEV